MAAGTKEELDKLRKEYEKLNEEFSEFKETSKELEEESDATLRQLEEQLKSTQSRLAAESREKQTLLERLVKATQGNAEIDRLNQELEKHKGIASELRARIASLETENDEFSQREREASAQNGLLQQRLDEALESVALAQDEHEELVRGSAEAEQRLLEELRDLQSEVTALKHGNHQAKELDGNSPANTHGELDSLREEVKQLRTQLQQAQEAADHHSSPSTRTPVREQRPPLTFTPSPRTPHAPTSAHGGSDTPLASVHQLLDRVQGLHSRLKSCRSRVGALLSPERVPHPAA